MKVWIVSFWDSDGKSAEAVFSTAGAAEAHRAKRQAEWDARPHDAFSGYEVDEWDVLDE